MWLKIKGLAAFEKGGRGERRHTIKMPQEKEPRS